MDYISAIPNPQDNQFRGMTGLVILGSTGSIGCNALRVVEGTPQAYKVHALAGGRNVPLLAEQAIRWRPAYLAIMDEQGSSGHTLAQELRSLLPSDYDPQILTGTEAYEILAALPDAAMVISAQAGAAGLAGTVSAALAGKVICLANKESLVLAGDVLRRICHATGAVILPVDSEHYALFQCLVGRSMESVSNLILTASGGPFRGWGKEKLRHVTPTQALRHPNWTMGARITIDSATLMNKGLELIEACRLYAMPPEKIKVVIHPQSLVHSLVEFTDNSLLAQVAVPDMRLPLAACMAWPRTPLAEQTGVAKLDLTQIKTMEFFAPDMEAFPCLALAYRALTENLTVELNAADEVAVERFLARDISFMDIPRLVEAMLDEALAKSAQDAGSTASEDFQDSFTLPDVQGLLAPIRMRDATTRNHARNWRA